MLKKIQLFFFPAPGLSSPAAVQQALLRCGVDIPLRAELPKGYNVSLSHTRSGTTVVAVAQGCRVGVDIEVSGMIGMVADHHIRHPKDPSRIPTDKLWAMKEAAYKACPSQAHYKMHFAQMPLADFKATVRCVRKGDYVIALAVAHE